jgi:transposase
MEWAKSGLSRDQLVLFPSRLDEAIEPDHQVRLLDDILRRLDWSKWEGLYARLRGQPPIHPRILASVIIYGLMTRIRSSRSLEEALQVRLDFQWLVEGFRIDHTTISEFRRKHAQELKDIFVQIGLLARQAGWLSLDKLAFDGTRMRANNRRSGARTPEQLRAAAEELAEKFTLLEAKAAAADRDEDQVFGRQGSGKLSEELADIKRRRSQVDAALAELERLQQEGLKVPARLPVTDPQSRITPNKDGGFAPNYTPLATVDVESGLVVSADVISSTDEDKHLLAAVQDVQSSFALEEPPSQLLADGLMATGENLAACEALGIELYSPIKGQSSQDNPALRADPSRPVPAELRDSLPVNTLRRSGKTVQQLDKQAFIYDAQADCYWCPEGKRLSYSGTTLERRSGGTSAERDRYRAAAEDCGACPLAALCLQGKNKQRSISREQYEAQREAHAQKMSTPEAKQIYARRRHPGERPFAMIKHHMGARRFLLRGLAKVTQEWRWLVTAFNLQTIIERMRRQIGPPAPEATA